MNHQVAFETPENIHVSYRLAGVGTRFVAWFVDQLILTAFCILFAIVSLIVGASLGWSLGGWLPKLDPKTSSDPAENARQIVLIAGGVSMAVWSLGGFVYFGLSELILRGQTIGKRLMRIRVVNTDGFSLHPAGVLVRTIFRLIDQLPVLWIVPVITKQQQRFGDMTARTLVVSDETTELSPLREALANHPPAESRFRFDATMLKKCRSIDFEAAEQLVERWNTLAEPLRDTVAEKIVTAIAGRVGTEAPPPAEQRAFLIDLLAAEFRRQSRSLG
ncbi:RDD family protein [Lacipirellula parvula]|uniref:RDD domain-containing protein n=1 Tax=Lacipirellula parvula TaxID=2650471 RepID=A0A5K7XF62_9BACT|nr:RDD family protein [Lacipirellula parvula]BBO34687.1 hypothetical protein PLANPX_4299 [Lacipirellula parvula]